MGGDNHETRPRPGAGGPLRCGGGLTVRLAGLIHEA